MSVFPLKTGLCITRVWVTDLVTGSWESPEVRYNRCNENTLQSNCDNSKWTWHQAPPQLPPIHHCLQQKNINRGDASFSKIQCNDLIAQLNMFRHWSVSSVGAVITLTKATTHWLFWTDFLKSIKLLFKMWITLRDTEGASQCFVKPLSLNQERTYTSCWCSDLSMKQIENNDLFFLFSKHPLSLKLFLLFIYFLWCSQTIGFKILYVMQVKIYVRHFNKCYTMNVRVNYTNQLSISTQWMFRLAFSSDLMLQCGTFTYK